MLSAKVRQEGEKKEAISWGRKLEAREDEGKKDQKDSQKAEGRRRKGSVYIRELHEPHSL